MLDDRSQHAKNLLVSRFLNSLKGWSSALSMCHVVASFRSRIFVNWYNREVGTNFLGNFFKIIDFISESEASGGSGCYWPSCNSPYCSRVSASITFLTGES